MAKIQTRALVEGAVFAGVTALLGIIYYYVQFLGIIAMVWPVPVIIVGYRNGLKASILSALSAGLIVSLLTHPFVGIGLLVGFGLPGILMGYLISKKVSPYVIIVVCGLILSFTMVGELLLSLMASGIDPVQFVSGIETTFKQQLDVTMNIYKSFGVAEKDIQYMGDYFRQSIDMMKLIFPSALLISGFIFSIIDYKLTRLILKRTGHVIPDVEQFSKWRLSRPFALILLSLAALAVLVSYFNISQLTALALNITTLLMLTFFIVGLSVVIHYAGVFGERQGVPKAIRNLIVAFLIISLMQFISLVGIADTVFDFRKLESDKK